MIQGKFGAEQSNTFPHRTVEESQAGHTGFPSAREQDDMLVRRLLAEIEAKDKEIAGLVRWVVILAVACFILLALGANDEYAGPEWTGVSHVGGGN